LDDFVHAGFDAPEFGVDGLQLLGGLQAGPVAGVGADVDVELY
jgi:hypothetical protein